VLVSDSISRANQDSSAKNLKDSHDSAPSNRLSKGCGIAMRCSSSYIPGKKLGGTVILVVGVEAWRRSILVKSVSSSTYSLQLFGKQLM